MRGKWEPKGKENECACTDTHAHKDRQDKGKGDKQKEGHWRNHPTCLARAACSSISCCFMRSIQDMSASVNQDPDTGPFDKYLSCLALYHFSFHQINLDSSNKKSPDVLPDTHTPH